MSPGLSLDFTSNGDLSTGTLVCTPLPHHFFSIRVYLVESGDG